MRKRIVLNKKIETNSTINRKITRTYQYPIYTQESVIEESKSNQPNDLEELNENIDEQNEELDNEYQNYEENDNYSENNDDAFFEENNNDEDENNNIQNKINNASQKINNVNNTIKKAKDIKNKKEKAEAAAVVLKNPLVWKIILIILAIALIAFAVIFFIMLIVGYQQNSYMTLNSQCSTITVINTDCDENGDNCTNRYSGQVSLEDYIAGVIAAETEDSINDIEYYKLTAITTRTELLNNLDISCEVEGNSSFKEYIDIEENVNKDVIRQAIDEVKDKVLVKDDFLYEIQQSTACLVNSDSTYYYIRYGSETLEEPKIQKISKEWSQKSPYNILLQNLSQQITSNNDYYNKSCPLETNDYGLSTIGALYLINNENYTYEDIIKYYYGEEITIKNIYVQTSEEVNGFINPLRNIYCSSPYQKERIHPVYGFIKPHEGIDIGAAEGTPIYATKEGTISYLRNDVTEINSKESTEETGGGYGNQVYIDHGDGTMTIYAHMKYDSIPNSLNIGTKVGQGEQIGEVGSTGVSTGYHLHYEIRINGETVDPSDYMDLTNASGTCKE